MPRGGSEEQTVKLLTRASISIERIVSNGQASPPGFWYEQPQAEWVLLLQGEAQLRFEDEPAPRVLKPGDFVEISPRRRHRVEFTHPHLPTVWLAVHCD
jgi:cupin 2 domain-containing protein